MSSATDAPTPIAKYRAKAPCRAGGFFRRAGEEFEMPMLEEVPAHLEEVGAAQAASVNKSDIGAGNSDNAPADKAVKAPAKKAGAAPVKPAAIPKDAQVNKEDIGAAGATPAQDVTSADMVTK